MNGKSPEGLAHKAMKNASYQAQDNKSVDYITVATLLLRSLALWARYSALRPALRNPQSECFNLGNMAAP
jgi:hypothetical protein